MLMTKVFSEVHSYPFVITIIIYCYRYRLYFCFPLAPIYIKQQQQKTHTQQIQKIVLDFSRFYVFFFG